MARPAGETKIDWESTFSQWAQAPSQTEQARCDNAVSLVRNAIAKHGGLNNRLTTIFAQGSYRNRVNVRKESDVDVGVLCYNTFHYELAKNLTPESVNIQPATYHYSQFKSELEEALVNHVGRAAVTRGNKSIKVRETSYHVEADVVPVFEFHQYFEDKGVRYGVSLQPDSGRLIQNYPERLLSWWPNVPLHYENAVSKNSATGRRFKSVVRIVKKLRNAMEDGGYASAKPIPSYLIECMVWNVANSRFTGTSWLPTVRDILSVIWDATSENLKCSGWCEVDNIKYLFHGSQPWSRVDAHAFIDDARQLIGYD